MTWLNNRNQGQELSKNVFFFSFFFKSILNNLFSYSYKNHKNKQNVVKALMKLTFIHTGWEMYSCQRLWSFFFSVVLLWSCDHNSTILATPVASISGALYSGRDHLVGHSLAVLGQAQETHEVDETSGKVQLAAKLAGCIVIGERVVVVVKSLTCRKRHRGTVCIKNCTNGKHLHDMSDEHVTVTGDCFHLVLIKSKEKELFGYLATYLAACLTNVSHI